MLLNKINLSLSSGYVPLALIKLLLKGESTLDPEVLANYRPISKLPFVSKILEKVVSNQLCEFLRESNVYEDFLELITALAKVTNDLLIASDQGFVSVLVLLDVSPAFDTIDLTFYITDSRTVNWH